MKRFIIIELLLSIVWIIGVLVLREFAISRDGILRKIMITYFSVEVFTYLGVGLYLLATEAKWDTMSVDIFIIVIIVPKVFVKLWLLWYFKRGRNKLKSPL